MKRLPFALLFTALTAGAADTPPSTADIKWLQGSQAKETLALEALKARGEEQEVTVWEPREGKEATYRGFSLRDLLTKIYGNTWKKADELEFTTASGSPVSIELARLLRGDAFLVHERVGSDAFTATDRAISSEAPTKLGPYYLVWDNLKSREIRKRGSEGWITGVTSIDLLQFADRNPQAAPATDAKPEAKEGFFAFRAQCLSCHTMNGEGGKGGPELNYPASVTEYLNPVWLSRWMLDPTSVRYNTTMPAIDLENKDRKQIAKSITAYLKAMASEKRKPASTTP